MNEKHEESGMNKIRKLTFVSAKIARGGAERVISVLCNSLVDLGYQVDLILYERRDDEYPISPKVNIHLLPEQKNGESKVSYYVGKFIYFRKLLRRLNPDVLIPFLPYQVEQSFLASRGLGIPFIVTVRNNPKFDTPNEKMRRHRDWIAKYAEAVFVQNQEQKAYFPENIQKKTFVVPNPVQDAILNSEYEFRGSVQRLVSMGRLEEQKNFSLLIKAFAEVKKKFPKLILDIYGKGSLENELQSLIDSLKVHDSVRLCGRTNNVAETLGQYDLFIMSSNYEGMPNALMEAMGVGLPCISTDCPTGPKELLGKNERGILVAPENIEELACAIEYSICNITEIKNKAQDGKKYIHEMFSPDKVATLLVDELEKILRPDNERNKKR